MNMLRLQKQICYQELAGRVIEAATCPAVVVVVGEVVGFFFELWWVDEAKVRMLTLKLSSWCAQAARALRR